MNIKAIMAQMEQSGDVVEGLMEVFEELNDRDRAGERFPAVVETLWLAMSADIAMNNDGPEELVERGDEHIAALRAVGAPRTADRLATALRDVDNADLDEWAAHLEELELALVRYLRQHEAQLSLF